MSYSVKQSEMTSEQWREMRRIEQGFVCSVCRKRLTIHTMPLDGAMVVGCLDAGHTGWVEPETAVQEYRRAGELELPYDLDQAMSILRVRYPAAIVDRGTAALFLADCVRLGLDPLMSPAEAVPVPFKAKDDKGMEIQTVVSITTIDGWLSMAARGCPDKWAGPPSVEPVFDEKIAESLCSDPKAWIYKAAGRTKDMAATQLSTAYGFYTRAEFRRDAEKKKPAAAAPGNQAAVRAVKRWVRANFPECRQRMIEQTSELRARARGAAGIEEIIDAEYCPIDEKVPPAPAKDRPPGRAPGRKQARSKSEARENYGAEPAGPESKVGRGGATGKADATNFNERGEETPKKSEAPAGGEAADLIDLMWLQESLNALKWSVSTVKSYLARYNISIDGDINTIVSRLSRENAENFVAEIQLRLDGRQKELF